MLKLIIEIPALDRLIDYLEGRSLDSSLEVVAAEILRLTAKLATSESTLKESINHG